MFFYEFTVEIVLAKFTEESSEFNSVISIFGVFNKNMLEILFEDVEGEIDWEKITDFNFKSIPNFFLVSCVFLHLISVEHGNICHGLNEFFLRYEFFSCLSD
jgi:hypothetical protein